MDQGSVLNEPLLPTSNGKKSWRDVFFILFQVLVFVAIVFLSRQIFMQASAEEGELLLYEIFLYYSPFLLGILMLFLWGLDLLVFTTVGIDYSRELDLDQNHLTYFEIWKSAYCMMIWVMASMILYLSLHSSGEVSWGELQPGVLFVATIVILLVPCDTFYGSSRRCFLRRLGSVVHLSQEITFPAVFIVDVLTSIAKVFADLACSILRYADGQVATRAWYEIDSVCRGHYVAIPATMISPFIFRFIFCLRQFYDRKECIHLWNALKYLMMIISLILSSSKYFVSDLIWVSVLFPIWVGFNITTSIYAFGWDVAIDWNIMRRMRTPHFRPNGSKLKWVM